MSSASVPSVDNSNDENQIVICELIYRLRKELAFSTGANNMIRTLSEQKKLDQKSTRRAFETRTQAEEKIDLIRLALKKYSQPLTSTPLRSPVSPDTEMELTTYSLFNTTCCSHKNLKHKPLRPVSGHLMISLIGCGDLVSKVEGRDSCWNCYDSILSSASKGKRKARSLHWSTSPKNRRSMTCGFPPTVCSVVPPRSPVSSLSTYHNASFSTHPEVFALVKVDNHVVASTKPKPMSSYCWDERFYFELKQNRELEIEIYYRDARSMCAFCVLRLDELTTNKDMPLKTSFEMEPQGVLYVDMNFFEYVSPLSNASKQRRVFRSEVCPQSSSLSSFHDFSSPLKSAHRMSRSTAKKTGRQLPFVNFFQRAFSVDRRRVTNNLMTDTKPVIPSTQNRKISLFGRLTSNAV